MKKVNETHAPPFKFRIVEEKGTEVLVEVTAEDYAHELANGVLPEETLSPGLHKFIRGGFRQRHPDFDPATAKTTVEVQLRLDLTAFEFFERLAQLRNAASYQEVMREILETYAHEQTQAAQTEKAEMLLHNHQFIEAVAQLVQQHLTQKAALPAPVSNKRQRRAA